MDAISIKLVLIGNTAVGKTCIVRRAVDDVFSDDTTPTLGASYLSKLVKIGDTEVRVQIWDTAGQERYRGMTPMYFRGAHVAILAYSVTDRNSFESVDSWVASLRDNGDPSVIVFLVGNKCDVEDERAVLTAQGEEKAAELRAQFYEVSAKTGDRIEDLFIDVSKVYLEKANLMAKPAARSVNVEAPKKAKKCCS
jgi:small GTP-binding protein